MGKKLELIWEGYGFTPDGRNPDQPFELDEDLEKVVDHFKMVHEMWAAKEAVRFEDGRENVDATPFGEDDLRVVEYAYRLACLKVDMAFDDRRKLHAKWSTARRFHWKHVEEIDAMEYADDLLDEARDHVPELIRGERTYNCECAVLLRKIQKIDRRIKRRSRYIALIRHALYVRGQYASGVEVAEWTGQAIRKMVLDFDMVPCECRECEQAAQTRTWIKNHGADGMKLRERDEGTKHLLRITKPFSMSAQLKEIARERKKEENPTGALVLGGQKVLRFGVGANLRGAFNRK